MEIYLDGAMQLNTAAGLGLFFLGSFALLYTTIHIPSVEFYTGGIVIGLFIFGLFYSFGNAIRQGNKIEDSEAQDAPKVEQAQKQDAERSVS